MVSAPVWSSRRARHGGMWALALVAGLSLSTVVAAPALARSGPALDSTAFSDVAERAVRSVVNVATTRRGIPPTARPRGVCST